MEGEETNQQVTNSNEELVITPENNGEVAVARRKRKRDEMASKGGDATKACKFPINTIEIGQWKNEPKRHNEEMTFRCYFKKDRFAWEALIETKKMKVEYRWDIIQAIQLTELTNINGGKLEILLKSTDTPLFFREKDLQPNKHSEWESCEDFTKLDPKARRQGVHDLYFEGKHFKNLREKILAAADILPCLKNLIVAPLEPEASSSVQDQVPLPNGNHNVNSTCEPQVQQQIAYEPQVQRHYNHTRESYLRSVSYMQHHTLPPYPPSCSQVYHNDMISPPISGVSHFPTQRVVLGQGNVFNNGFPGITGNGSLNQLQLTHQQHSLPFVGSPSSPSYPNQYDCLSIPWRDHQEYPKADVDMQLERYTQYKQLPLSANGHNNSMSPPTNGGGAELVTTDPDEEYYNQVFSEFACLIADDIDNSISPPTTDGSSAGLYANIDSSSSPPTDGSGVEMAPGGAHQSHQNNQGDVMTDGMKNQGGDGDLYSIINYPVIQKSL